MPAKRAKRATTSASPTKKVKGATRSGNLLTEGGSSVAVNDGELCTVQGVRLRAFISHHHDETLTLDRDASTLSSDARERGKIEARTSYERRERARQAYDALSQTQSRLLNKLELGNSHLLSELHQTTLDMGKHRQEFQDLYRRYRLDVQCTKTVRVVRATLKPGVLTQLSFLPAPVVWCPAPVAHAAEKEWSRRDNTTERVYMGDLYNCAGSLEASSEAKHFYRLGAEAGDEYCLAKCHLFGIGVPKNEAEALALYRRLADQGLASAQNMLGCMYMNGSGVEANVAEAARLYRCAANQGLASAQNNLGFMYKHGMGVCRDLRAAARLYQRSAQQGYSRAQYHLACMHEHGVGVAKNLREAARLYRCAADQGLASAQHNLGWMYTRGKGVDTNLKEAARLYRCAADQNLPSAQHALAQMYERGKGVDQDIHEATRLYKLAADRGLALAKSALGRMHPQETRQPPQPSTTTTSRQTCTPPPDYGLHTK